MLDVFFLSYNEDFANENFGILQMFAPNAKRVEGVKGIFEAHKECARLSQTTHFYVVDADAVIDELFAFKFIPSRTECAYPSVPEADCIYTWRSHNPVNDLIYGYGAVKLFPKKQLMEASDWKVDMSTTLGTPFVPKFQISNVTAFNTDPFNAWKSAFRECVKLSSQVIPYTHTIDDEYRLQVWCTKGVKRPFGNIVWLGPDKVGNLDNIIKETLKP